MPLGFLASTRGWIECEQAYPAPTRRQPGPTSRVGTSSVRAIQHRRQDEPLPRGKRPSSPFARYVFPAAIAPLVLVLGLAGVTGSSLGIYATSNGATESQADMLTGPARGIRSDEWLVRTPWVLAQLEQGLPGRAAGGVGVHDAAVLLDLPTKGWEVVLRPHTAVYHLLGGDRAFAMEWWTLLALQLLGVYALLVTLTSRVAISALAASLVTLSPVTQWWTIPATFTTIGYGSLATALALLAYRAGTGRRRIGLSVLAGLVLAAFLTALYPPWQIGTALVLVPVGVGSVIPDLIATATRRHALRSLALVLPVALLIGGGLFGVFTLQHRDAIETISSTVYPGHRSASVGGGTPLPIVLGSTFDSFSSGKPFSLVNGTNQSENSSALPLLLPVFVATLGLLVARRLGATRLAPALVGSLVGGTLVVGWMLLPVPAGAGRFLLLSRVPPSRLLLPLGLVGVIALALLASHQSERGVDPSRWYLLLSVGVLGAALTWAAPRYTVDGMPVDMRWAAAYALVVLVGVALSLRRRPVPGLAVLVAFSLWQASLINPVQAGMDPLTASPLRRAIDSVGRGETTEAAWVAFSIDATVKGTLLAAGVNNLAGVSPYPDRAAWRVLDPELANEDVWNRYAHISFTAAAPGTVPTFTLLGPDNLSVAVDPCSPALRELGARFVVTQGFELGSCVQALVKVRHGTSFVMVYRYRP